MVTSVIWPDRSRPICRVLPESLWDSQRTPRQNQICQNVKHAKTPNALFPISLQFLRELKGFIPCLTRYGMRVKYEQQFYDVSDADFERWQNYKAAFVVFVVGDPSNILIVPAAELKNHIKAEHRQPSEEYADYKLHLIKGDEAYTFRELPNLNLTKYHNAYRSLRRA